MTSHGHGYIHGVNVTSAAISFGHWIHAACLVIQDQYLPICHLIDPVNPVGQMHLIVSQD